MKDELYVYWDEQAVKTARIHASKGRVSLQAVDTRMLAGATETEKVKALIESVQAVYPRARKAHLVISSKFLITKNIEVPSMDPKEIEDIVRLQAGRHTPYSRDEIIVSHLNLEIILDRYTKALLFIVSNEVIRKATDLLLMAGIEVDTIRLAAESMPMVRSTLGASDAESECILCLDRNESDYIVISHGKPVFVRNIPIGLGLLEESREKFMTALSDEIKKSTDAYLSEAIGKTPTRFVLMDLKADPATDAVAHDLSGRIGTPCDVLALGPLIDVPESVRQRLTALNADSFASLAMDAATGDRLAVNLLPEDIKIRKRFREKGQQIFMTAILAMVIFIGMMSSVVSKIYFRSAYLEAFQKEFAVKREQADRLEILSEDLRRIREFKAKKNGAYHALEQLGRILPEEVYLAEVSLDKEKKITLKGTSDYMSTVFSFVTQFESSDYFETVTTDFTKSRKEQDKDVADFGISAHLEGV